MAQEIADSTLLDTWASSGLIVEPDVSKIIEGWQLGEQPPHEYMNWLQNTFGSKLNHILKNGVALWNNETEYLAGSSVQHNGNVWLCKTTNTNSEPTESNNNWAKTTSGLTQNITVDVGAGQTYTTINQALEYLSGFYPMYKKSGVTATINLKAGFVMAEQVLVSGIDLGWITIVGEDAETIITHTALTTAFNDDYPVFGVDKGGTSPVIGQLFRFNVEKVGGGKHGLLAFGTGSSATVLPNKGFIGAGNHGIYAANGSTVNAYGANCSNAGTYGIVAANSSTINVYNANCSNAGDVGIFALNSSTVNAYGANCSNAGTYGIFALNSSTINAYGANCSKAGTYGIVAANGSTINAYGANCSNAVHYGIFANDGSTISANGAIVKNQTTGAARVVVDTGSTINASKIDTTGGTAPAFSQAVNTLTANGIIYYQ